MFLSGVPTFILMGMILTNPFTEKLFYFDLTEGYVEGSWYKLMYYSALGHMAAAFILIILWSRRMGYRKTMVLLEILVISGSGVVIQFLDHSLLMTGFGLSLGEHGQPDRCIQSSLSDQKMQGIDRNRKIVSCHYRISLPVKAYQQDHRDPGRRPLVAADGEHAQRIMREEGLPHYRKAVFGGGRFHEGI